MSSFYFSFLPPPPLLHRRGTHLRRIRAPVSYISLVSIPLFEQRSGCQDWRCSGEVVRSLARRSISSERELAFYWAAQLVFQGNKLPRFSVRIPKSSKRKSDRAVAKVKRLESLTRGSLELTASCVGSSGKSHPLKKGSKECTNLLPHSQLSFFGP